jgi:hypothetical protein
LKQYVGACLSLFLYQLILDTVRAGLYAVVGQQTFTLVIYVTFGTVLVAALWWLDKHVPMPSEMV